MSFTFLHTADWHIGKPFRNFPEPISVVLREARLDAIDRLADVARGAGARHVLVAGDVYDTDRLPMKELLQPIARMAKHQALIWHLLPGNHDAAGAGSLWRRLAAHGLPENARLHLHPEPLELEAGAWLLPAPLYGRTQSQDPVAYMQHCVTPVGVLRIGLAHGSVRDFGTNNQAAVRIDPDRVGAANIDYLALGDWHGLRQVSNRCWYSGTPEPDSYDNNHPGHAVLVTIAAPGAMPVAKPVAIGRFRWAELKRCFTDWPDVERIEADIANLGVADDQIVLRLGLSGQVSLQMRGKIEHWLFGLEPRLRYLVADLSELAPAPSSGDLALLQREREIGAAAMRLREIAEQGAPADRLTARRALARLYQMAVEDESALAK